MIEDSFITLHRKFLKWEWYTDSKMCQLFIYFLLSATHTDTRFKGIELKRGQLLTGLKSINKNTGISSQSARTCIKRLKSTGEITVQSTSLYSIITICKYNDYQNKKNKVTIKPTVKITNDQQATNNIQQYNNEIINYIINSCPNVSKIKTQLTIEQAEILIKQFPIKLLKLKLDAMDNKVGVEKKYKTVYKTLLAWCEMDKSPQAKINTMYGQVEGN